MSKKTIIGVSIALFALIWTQSPGETNAAAASIPDVPLQALNGEIIMLHEAVRTNALTVMNFWAAWCAPCIAEFPEFERVYRAVKTNGVEFFAINVQPAIEEKEARDFLKKRRISFAVFLDPEGVVRNAANANGFVPITLFLDSNATVKDAVYGRTTESALKEKISALLAETSNAP